MIRDDDLYAALRSWFEDDAPGPEPRRLLSAVLELTRSRRPRPRWVARLRGGGLGLTPGRPMDSVRARASVVIFLVLLTALALTAVSIVGSRPSLPPTDDGVFEPTGSLVGPVLSERRATLLADGRVLVVGGSARGDSAAAEVYDPGSGTWSSTGSLGNARSDHTATLLDDGRVLVAGGLREGSAELYEPATGKSTPTGSMASPRMSATATRLADGRVLIAGGGAGSDLVATATAELYDPATGTFTPTGSMTEARLSHGATLLADGRVLVVGGLAETFGSAVATAELYDPTTGTWDRTGSPSVTGRTVQTVLLPDGRVLLAGGSTGSEDAKDAPEALSALELYVPDSGTFVPAASMTAGRVAPSLTLLSDGRVLIAGGMTSEGVALIDRLWRLPVLRSAEIYDPRTDSVVETGSLVTERTGQTAMLLPDGDVLVVGGEEGDANAFGTAERFHP
jgi:hypothetical protein